MALAKISELMKKFQRSEYSVALLVILVFGLLLYGHTLYAPFYLDDSTGIYGKSAVKNLPLAFRQLLAQRGLSTLTFAFNYRLGAENPFGYHLVNIAIHMFSACLVLLLLCRVFPGERRLQLFGALIFVAHPLQTQGVTYLVQRMTSLSTCFFLLALLLFIRAREALAAGVLFREGRHLRPYLGALVAGMAAILAKENAVVLPLALLLFCRFFLPGDVNSRWRPLLLYTAPFLVAPVLAIIAYLLVPVAAAGTFSAMGESARLQSMEGNSPLHYLVTEFSVLWIYIRMLFLPYGQALDHGYPVARELVTLKSFSGLIGLLLLGWGAIRIRSRQPAISFGILWFFLTLMIESSVIPLDPLFEHRLYLPMFGFSIVLPAVVALIPQRQVTAVLMVSVVVMFGLLTWRRNALWNDPVAMYQDNLLVAPHNERVHFNLGETFREIGNFEAAEWELVRSVDLNPHVPISYQALTALYRTQGRIDDLVLMLESAIENIPKHWAFYNDLALAYSMKGDYSQAIAQLHKAIEINPKAATAYFNLAQMLFALGRKDEVEQPLRQCLAVDPGHADARTMLIDLLNSQGRAAEAAEMAQRW